MSKCDKKAAAAARDDMGGGLVRGGQMQMGRGFTAGNDETIITGRATKSKLNVFSQNPENSGKLKGGDAAAAAA